MFVFPLTVNAVIPSVVPPVHKKVVPATEEERLITDVGVPSHKVCADGFAVATGIGFTVMVS